MQSVDQAHHSASSVDLVQRLWTAVNGGPSAPVDVRFSGPEGFLPSVFDVTGFASATVAVATSAVAELLAAREGDTVRPVTVDRRAASAAFGSEALFTPTGWHLPALWDPIAGNYRSADGWIRLHTNYRYHREAVERVLGLTGRDAADRADVTAAVAGWPGDELEAAVVRAGGCAAVQRDRAAWLGTEAGAASAAEPLLRIERRPTAGADWPPGGPDPRGPLAGLRVLDLTRVIAGPVATGFLAAYGAAVLRVDPPSFAEVPALLPVTSAGKRCTALDLRAAADRAAFAELVAGADVLVCGLRPGALDRLGYPDEALRALNPDLITARLDAYGWSGPWVTRRGFDSLAQLSCGISAAGAAASGQDAPRPLPAQALDHGTGYLLAAAIVRAVQRLATEGETSSITGSLVGTANVLIGLPTPDGLTAPAPAFTPADTEPVETAWGPARSVPVPGTIDGVATHRPEIAGLLGRHAPSWTPR